jgi:hypothetical protein
MMSDYRSNSAEELFVFLGVVGTLTVIGLLALVFGGTPDMADGWFCERVKADPQQCARLLGITTVEEVTTRTTKPVAP